MQSVKLKKTKQNNKNQFITEPVSVMHFDMIWCRKQIILMTQRRWEMCSANKFEACLLDPKTDWGIYQ